MAISKMKGTRLGAFRAYFFGFFVCTAGFLFGYDTGIVGGVLSMESYESSFGYTDTTTVSAVMVSLQNAGAFLAAIFCFPISDRFGRKTTVQGAMTVFCIGVILQVVPSHSLACYYIGRVIAGLGLGCGTATVPAYNAEVAPKEIRGMVGSGVQLLFTLGVMISYWVTYGTYRGLEPSAAQWQIPVGLQMVPAGALAIGLFMQKESPRWLAKKGRWEEAWDSLTWFRADDSPEVAAEFNEIKVGLEEELRATEGFKKRELLEPANRYRILLSIFMFCAQQCTGMTALAYFGPQIFGELTGNNKQQALLITGLFGAQKFVTCCVYVFGFSERWNRKPTLWISAFVMAVCFIIVTVVDQTRPAAPANGSSSASSAGIAAVAMIFITNSVYQFSWGPLPWPYVAEIFPSRIREIGVGTGVSTQWLFNFLFSLVTPYMVADMSSFVFIFYAALDVVMGIVVLLFVKETRNRTLEEMETIFNSRAKFDVGAARQEGAEGGGIIRKLAHEEEESVHVDSKE